jgi:hypothetical protein
MADVTTTFAAKDESFASTVDKLSGRLQGFQGQTQSFTSKVGEMAKGFASFVGPIAAVGAAFLGARGIVNSFRDAIDMGGKLNDLSARTGETAGNLAVLQRAFENAGSSGEAVGPMLNRLQRFMVEAGQGSKAQVEAMDRLGLSYEQLKTMTPTAQMELLAQKISAIPDPAQRSALAMEIFGRSGGELMPLLRSMGVELDTARAQLGSYPAVIDKTNKALDDIGDNFNAISTKSREFATGLLVDLAPALVDITDKIAKIDAAGFGMAISNYFASFMKAAAGAYRLGEAIESVKLAIEAMGQGDIGGGLKLMWVTMRNVALNAINEIFNNFRAGIATVGDALRQLFAPGSVTMAYIEGASQMIGAMLSRSIGGAIADILSRLPFMQTAAAAMRGFVQEANKAVKDISALMYYEAENLAKEWGEVGAAMAENFGKYKNELPPLFDLTDEFAEQARLQEEIRSKLAESALHGASLALSAASTNSAMQAFANTLERGNTFAAGVATNLNNASLATQSVPEAFSLGAESTDKIAVDLQNTAKPAEEASGWLEKGAEETEKISIHGNELATKGNEFALAINRAKIDAQITAQVFTGLSNRMNAAVNGTSKMLDQMRESFHFGSETSQETAKRLQAGGAGLIEAARGAAEVQKRQSENERNMRSLEAKERQARRRYEEQMEEAARLERNKQDGSAHNKRMKAQADLAKALEEIRPELEAGAKESKKLLEESGGGAGKKVQEGGEKGGEAVQEGGEAAGKAMKDAAEAMKQERTESQAKLALEATLQACRDFLKSIDKKLPQHALT